MLEKPSFDLGQLITRIYIKVAPDARVRVELTPKALKFHKITGEKQDNEGKCLEILYSNMRIVESAEKILRFVQAF